MNLEELRDQIRAYIRGHTKGQGEIAKECAVSASWLNKFLNGSFDNLRVRTLQRLVEWYERDRRANSRGGYYGDCISRFPRRMKGNMG